MTFSNSLVDQKTAIKIDDLRQRLAAVRDRLKDPATPRSERPRLKLQRDTYAWLLDKLGRTRTLP